MAKIEILRTVIDVFNLTEHIKIVNSILRVEDVLQIFNTRSTLYSI